MEQKRTLWIIAAAGVFLLVVAGAALILYSPSLHRTQPVQTVYNPADGWVNAPEKNQVPPLQGNTKEAGQMLSPFETQTQPAEPFPFTEQNPTPIPAPDGNPLGTNNVTVITDNTTIYGSGTTTTIDLNALKSGTSAETVTAKNDFTSSQMSKAAAQAETRKENSVQEVSSAQKTQTESIYTPATPAQKTQPAVSNTTKTTASAKTESTAAKTSKSTSAATASEKKETAAPLPDSYWIQVGSYGTKKAADDARAVLESNKIQSEVFTYKDSKGKLFYRVRVGPYTTTSEAEYWQTRINLIKEFENSNSYVTNANAKIK